MILSIATRPDCLGPEVLELLAELNRKQPVWVELGLQTICPESAACPYCLQAAARSSPDFPQKV